jgi:hypothetical protein
MKHLLLTEEELARIKWVGLPDSNLAEFEARQRERIGEIEALLDREKRELERIILARTDNPTEHMWLHGSLDAPAHYSNTMTWKDKIIAVIREAKRPMLAREIAPVILLWEPMNSSYDVPKIVSVNLTDLVRHGALTKTKRKGQSGSWYALPEED